MEEIREATERERIESGMALEDELTLEEAVEALLPQTSIAALR